MRLFLFILSSRAMEDLQYYWGMEDISYFVCYMCKSSCSSPSIFTAKPIHSSASSTPSFWEMNRRLHNSKISSGVGISLACNVLFSFTCEIHYHQDHFLSMHLSQGTILKNLSMLFLPSYIPSSIWCFYIIMLNAEAFIHYYCIVKYYRNVSEQTSIPQTL